MVVVCLLTDLHNYSQSQVGLYADYFPFQPAIKQEQLALRNVILVNVLNVREECFRYIAWTYSTWMTVQSLSKLALCRNSMHRLPSLLQGLANVCLSINFHLHTKPIR